jgi:hypothetical protein
MAQILAIREVNFLIHWRLRINLFCALSDPPSSTVFLRSYSGGDFAGQKANYALTASYQVQIREHDRYCAHCCLDVIARYCIINVECESIGKRRRRIEN